MLAGGDVLGGQVPVGGAQEVPAVEVLLGPDRLRVDPKQPSGRDPQVAVQGRAWRKSPSATRPAPSAARQQLLAPRRRAARR